MEDLNHLYFRQQIELLRAQHTSCVAGRASHEELAHAYTKHIARFRARQVEK